MTTKQRSLSSTNKVFYIALSSSLEEQYQAVDYKLKYGNSRAYRRLKSPIAVQFIPVQQHNLLNHSLPRQIVAADAHGP